MIANWLAFATEFWPLQILLLLLVAVTVQARPFWVLLAALGAAVLVLGWAGYLFLDYGRDDPAEFFGGIIPELAAVTLVVIASIATAGLLIRKGLGW